MDLLISLPQKQGCYGNSHMFRFHVKWQQKSLVTCLTVPTQKQRQQGHNLFPQNYFLMCVHVYTVL